MNEWASPWASNPPTPQEIHHDKPPPSLPSVAPTFGYFDAFTNEASWGNEDEQPQVSRVGGGGTQEGGKIDALRVPVSEESQNRIVEERVDVNGSITERAESFANPIGDNYEEHNTGRQPVNPEAQAEATAQNGGLLDLDDDTFFNNAPGSGQASADTWGGTQKQELLDLMDDDFFGAMEDSTTKEVAGFDMELGHKDAELEQEGPANADTELPAPEDLSNHDGKEGFPVNHVEGVVTQSNTYLEQNSRMKLATLESSLLPESMDEPMFELTSSQDNAATANEEEVEAKPVDSNWIIENFIEAEHYSGLEEAKDVMLELQDSYPHDVINLDGKQQGFPSSTTSIPALQEPEAEHLAMSSEAGGLDEDLNSSHDIVDKAIDLPKQSVVDIGDEVYAALNGDDLKHSQTALQDLQSEDEIKMDTESYQVSVDTRDTISVTQGLPEAIGTHAEVTSVFEFSDQSAPGDVVNGGHDFGDFEESIRPDSPAQDSQHHAFPQEPSPEDAVNAGTERTRETDAPETEPAGFLGAKSIQESRPEIHEDAGEEPFPSFDIDKSSLSDLFPGSMVIPETEIPEPADLQIESTSARKTWYRISRQSSMRYYNGVDFDNYVRVTWPGSAIQAKVNAIVNKWVVADRQNGGSMFKARFRPSKLPSTLPENPAADGEPSETVSPIDFGMKISISKPPRSPTGFGWSSTSASSIHAIPGPPTPNLTLTPRATTPSHTLQVPMLPPTPVIPQPPEKVEAQEDDEFGIFVSSASPLPAEVTSNKAEDDFDDWFSSVDIPGSASTPAIPHAGETIVEQHPTASQFSSRKQNLNGFSDLSAQPQSSRQSSSPTPEHQFSSPSPALKTPEDQTPSSNFEQPEPMVEDQSSEISLPKPHQPVHPSDGSNLQQFTNTTALAASRTPIMPDWFSTPLIPSKPQTPVSANRSFSTPQASLPDDGWFDAPGMRKVSSQTIPNMETQETNIDDQLATTPSAKPDSPSALPPPPSFSPPTNHNTTDWFDDNFASPQSSIPNQFFSQPPQISISHPSTPYNSSPFIPPPPRPQSALAHISVIPQNQTPTAPVSSPLAAKFKTLNAGQEEVDHEDHVEDDFDDDFGGFESSPPPPVSHPSFGAVLDNGWGNGLPHQPSLSPQPSVVAVNSVSLVYQAPPATSQLEGLGLAFDSTFFDTPVAAAVAAPLKHPVPPPKDFAPPPKILARPPAPASNSSIYQDPWGFDDTAEASGPHVQGDSGWTVTQDSQSKHTEKAGAVQTPSLPPAPRQIVAPPSKASATLSVSTSIPTNPTDPWGFDDTFASTAAAVERNRAWTPEPEPQPQQEAHDAHVPEEKSDGVDQAYVEEVVRSLPDWSWIL